MESGPLTALRDALLALAPKAQHSAVLSEEHFDFSFVSEEAVFHLTGQRQRRTESRRAATAAVSAVVGITRSSTGAA